jgi:Cu/Ag efflux protein CusF
MKIKTIAAAAAIILLPAALAACGKDADQARNDDSMDIMDMEKGAQSDAPAAETAHGFGTVTSVDQEARKVTISHEPIPEIGWSAMTMAFAVDEPINVVSFSEGDNVHFILKPASEGTYTVSMACRIEGDMEAHKAAMKSMMEGMMDGDMMMDMEGGMVMPCTLDPR